MLNPSMQELMKRVGNRYLLVNLAAQRARDIADEAEEKGEPIQKTAECVVDLQMEAHIPETYIESLSQRLDIYRKIAAITTEEDQSELLDELIDRYGEPPKAILGLLTVALLRNRAAQLGITEITQRNQTLYFYIEHPTQEQITALACAYRGKIVFNGMQKPYIGVKLEPKRLPVGCCRERLYSSIRQRHTSVGW